MSIKSTVRTIKNIFQDAVIRIPYFHSTLKTTTIIAVLIENENSEQISGNVENILFLQKGIIGFQWKLYYEKQTCYKSAILQFDSINNAQDFYTKYAKNYDKSYTFANPAKMIDQKDDLKFPLYFAKDITAINMQQVLYAIGRVSIQVPESLFIRNMIKEVSKLIVVEGIRAQTELMKCKKLVLPTSLINLLDFMDPKFLSSESNYYRWRVYSYLQGDGQTNYRTQPYQMTVGGPLYYPPDEQSQKFVYRILNSQERAYITKLLDTITPRKFHIQQAMSFCINNTGSAVQICAIIAISIVESCQKLQADEQNKGIRQTEIKHLSALFYLISDIMFNSPLTIYRDIFTVLLPPLIGKLPNISELITKIADVVEVWKKKFILEDEFLNGLNLMLKKQLPSMKPMGMQQMTRIEHDCYKDLIKIENPDEIEEMCCKYGIIFSAQKITECIRNLAATLAMEKRESYNEIEPEPGAYDGEPLTDKDLQKIKGKTCRVVSLDDVNIKHLFEKERNSKSINWQRQ